ncbi:GntR family transcriptional regulator [Streptomyces sp. NPDC056061]|uniref:GntR family transcriptional regulator n=1 Tax=Streptomyces sp. NPDC056061 TaxID=3345700 RepID=UPI0035D998D2
MADDGTKYRRIADDIRANIANGHLAVGDRVPGENDIMARYDVARMTARQALAVLREDGIVDVQRGRGTFVRAAPRALSGSVEVPKELLQELQARHGLSEADLRRILPTAQVRLAETDDGGRWVVEYWTP